MPDCLLHHLRESEQDGSEIKSTRSGPLTNRRGLRPTGCRIPATSVSTTQSSRRLASAPLPFTSPVPASRDSSRGSD